MTPAPTSPDTIGPLLGQLGELFLRGGPVMWPLLAISVLSVALTVERAIFWLRTHTPGRRDWVLKAADHLRAGNTAAAQTAAKADKTLYATILTQTLAGHTSAGTGLGLIETHRPTIERFATVLSTIVTAAPLLGILGTVLGIIRSFELMGAGIGSGGLTGSMATGSAVEDLNAVAGGIAQALITTAFGLIVSLITLGPAMAFRSHADRCLGAIELLAEAGEHSTKDTK